jgi:Uma2 family endonuclease
MSPSSVPHFQLIQYLLKVFSAFFTLRPIGRAIGDPVLMRIDMVKVQRIPDVQIILNDNPGELTKNAMIGPADICIEVVSPESEGRDFVDKLREYERGGVGEYWILDQAREAALFYRLNEAGSYILQAVTVQGMYRTPKLPGFELHVPTLWGEVLPNYYEIGDMVKKMLDEEDA